MIVIAFIYGIAFYLVLMYNCSLSCSIKETFDLILSQ